MVAIDTFHPARHRCVIGVADEFHNDVLFIAEILEALPDPLDEHIVDIDAFGVEMQWRDEVLHSRPLGMSIDIAQLAHGLHAADLDALDFVRHQYFLERDTFGDLVIPDFDFDSPVQAATCFGQVGRHRLCIAGPFISYCFRR